MPKNDLSVPLEFIEEIILSLRGQRVMLDRDLAALYVTSGTFRLSRNVIFL